MTAFKLNDPIELLTRPGFDQSKYFTYDQETKCWKCFCGTTLLVRHHGNRWRHIRMMHPELIQRESD